MAARLINQLLRAFAIVAWSEVVSIFQIRPQPTAPLQEPLDVLRDQGGLTVHLDVDGSRMRHGYVRTFVYRSGIQDAAGGMPGDAHRKPTTAADFDILFHAKEAHRVLHLSAVNDLAVLDELNE